MSCPLPATLVIPAVSCYRDVTTFRSRTYSVQVHYTDPKTGLFHVGYLYSSEKTGSSGAAGATTDDLVTYRDIHPGEPLFIKPGGKNDPLAVFDGSVIP